MSMHNCCWLAQQLQVLSLLLVTGARQAGFATGPIVFCDVCLYPPVSDLVSVLPPSERCAGAMDQFLERCFYQAVSGVL
jgi:hypothetical protein